MNDNITAVMLNKQLIGFGPMLKALAPEIQLTVSQLEGQAVGIRAYAPDVASLQKFTDGLQAARQNNTPLGNFVRATPIKPTLRQATDTRPCGTEKLLLMA